MDKNVGRSERSWRIAAGALLVLTAMSRRKLIALMGLGLLYSAATQYCPVNEAMGRNSWEPAGDEETSESPARAQESFPNSARTPASEPRSTQHASI